MKQLLKSINNHYDKQQIEKFKSIFNNLTAANELSEQKELFTESFKAGTKTAHILCQVKIDIDSILAALCLPIIKNKLATAEELGLDKNIIKLIDDTTRFDQITYDENQEDSTNLRAMFVTMVKDIRTLIIKLADVTTTAKNPKHLTKLELDHLHKEIKDIYAPLAARLGLSFIKSELQDENFKYLEPEQYDYLSKEVLKDNKARQIALNKTIKRLTKLLKDNNIDGYVYGRIKHLSSIDKKMHGRAGGNLHNVLDLTAIRVIVPNVHNCYAILGEVHTLYTPIENTFRDYIGKPKANGYKSLHTTVFIENKQIVEIQVRTQEMHDFAEYGVAAHWLYKETKAKQNAIDKRLTWIRQIIENAESLSTSEIIDELQTDDYAGEIYVQTPKGNIIELPFGSTTVDFAYNVHSEVGNKCVGAKVNGKMVPLSTVLNNGEIVEIVTSSNGKGPSRDWLKFVKSVSAKSKINAYFKKERREDNIKRGKSILEQAAKTKNIQIHKLLDELDLKDFYERYSVTNIEDIYASVGHGALTATQVLTKLLRIADEQNSLIKKDVVVKTQVATEKREPRSDVIVIKGLDNLLIRFAKCCTPIPGDEIIGYVSRGRGATIHRANCKTVSQLEEERLIKAEWGNIQNATYQAEINIIVKNASGALAAITNKIAELKINIIAVSSNKISNDRSLINLAVNINQIEKLADLINKLKTLNSVIEIYRTNEN